MTEDTVNLKPVKGHENGVLTSLLLTITLDNILDRGWKTWSFTISDTYGQVNTTIWEGTK